MLFKYTEMVLLYQKVVDLATFKIYPMDIK